MNHYERKIPKGNRWPHLAPYSSVSVVSARTLQKHPSDDQFRNQEEPPGNSGLTVSIASMPSLSICMIDLQMGPCIASSRHRVFFQNDSKVSELVEQGAVKVLGFDTPGQVSPSKTTQGEAKHRGGTHLSRLTCHTCNTL